MNLTDRVQKLVQNERQMQEKQMQKASYEKQYANTEAELRALKMKAANAEKEDAPLSQDSNHYTKMRAKCSDVIGIFSRAKVDISNNQSDFEISSGRALALGRDLKLVENFDAIVKNARSNFDDILEREEKEAAARKAAQRSTLRKFTVIAVVFVIAYFMFV